MPATPPDFLLIPWILSGGGLERLPDLLKRQMKKHLNPETPTGVLLFNKKRDRAELPYLEYSMIRDS